VAVGAGVAGSMLKGVSSFTAVSQNSVSSCLAVYSAEV
jgi:hypothetical protein